MDTLLLFISTFGLVFFLGLQSLSANSGHYGLALLNSLVIGTFNLVLFKTVPAVHEPLQIAAYLVGGPLGIVSSMLLHRRVLAPMRERSRIKRAG